MKRLNGALCVLLALVLVLTGLNLQLHRAQPLFGTELPDTGVSAFLTAVPAPRQDACLTGAETSSITPSCASRAPPGWSPSGWPKLPQSAD